MDAVKKVVSKVVCFHRIREVIFVFECLFRPRAFHTLAFSEVIQVKVRFIVTAPFRLFTSFHIDALTWRTETSKKIKSVIKDLRNNRSYQSVIKYTSNRIFHRQRVNSTVPSFYPYSNIAQDNFPWSLIKWK